ncbi:dinitrogenase iron-molybdenum cofactor biosynthesis protein [Pseudodesulfovibrio sediminis]|uniref:Dinitrogenase iron-molybdenum cofactor biosynthesis domain-containing protein n=1 Tax=Pseudodesulfovibrio sediminis TaxID=2810563 RepID=A0ABN6ENH9_9BACT|nr:dinitrogenase iron-molybdenum cofactor biosynthesis protein [Pseudodesulfovibrio sediminis]BCS87788.1 hypothetical protein PSDVSF_10300 [Pseudodesulfovibrio sediminis]
MEKILIPILDNNIAPRFDLSADVLIVSISLETSTTGKIKEKVMLLDNPSAESMYRLIMSENIQTIICAGIEKEIYDFLKRKGFGIIDNICGPVDAVIDAYIIGNIDSNQSFY